MNYRKTILSLVAAMALSNTAIADPSATYLPLSTPSGGAGDASWILFGVSGFSNGIPSNAGATSTSFSGSVTELEDLIASDNLATDGLAVGGDNLASLQGLKEAGYSSVKVGVDITGITYEETEPVRTMYIKLSATGDPIIKFDYKASLEGKDIQLKLNNTGSIYTTKISEEATWNNAALAVEGAPNPGNDDDRTEIAEILDSNTTDNPINASNWDKDVHLQHVVANSNFYRFDAITQQWKVYKNRNAANANDFTELDKGSAYWGRVDQADAIPTINGNGTPTALILGTSGYSTQAQLPQAYLDDNNVSELTTGWNMLAYDDLHPYIRHAATGLILSAVATDDNLTITDDTGVYSTSNIIMVNGGDESDAMLINKTIESERLRGKLPKAFNVKAFQGAAAGEIILLSDKKFTVANNRAAGTISVKTINWQDPFVNGEAAAVGDLGIDPLVDTATSAYGEYAVVMNIMTGPSSVDSAGGFSKITFGDGLNSDHTAIAITSIGSATLAQAEVNIEAAATLTPVATRIDTDFDGTSDMMLVANEKPFYVRDATFTRVFDLATPNFIIDGTYTVAGGTSATVTPGAVGDVVGDFVGDINSAGVADVFAAASGAKLVVASNLASTFDLKDAVSTTADYFQNTTTDDNNATQGAIKGIYSIDSLAGKSITQYLWTYTDFTVPDADGDGININFSGITASGTAADANVTMLLADQNDTAKRLEFFNAVVTEINSQIRDELIHGYAYHNYTESADRFTTTTLTIGGLDVNATYLGDSNTSAGGGIFANPTDTNNTSVAGTFGTLQGDLVANLKFNAVYTPNYANYGPLYTMRDSGSGYEIKALLRATTDLNSTTGAISWDSIDITRDEDDWFIQNEFNLFSVNSYSGYWAYLADKTADAIVVSGVSYTPTYNYYFDNDGSKTTTNNVVGGTLTANIAGLVSETASLDGTTSNVYAIVGGEEIQMKTNSGTVYTADITKYESINFREGNTISFTIRATNGKGEAKKLTDAVEFDYVKPNAPTVTFPNATSAIFRSDSNDTVKFYVFDGAIPEIAADRTTAIIDSADATGGAGTANMCSSSFTFGDVNIMRVVALDGTGNFSTANVSDAGEFSYGILFKGSSVITHFNDGTTDKAITPTVYNDTCMLASPQPSGTENSGVSIKALLSQETASIAYKAADNVNFNTNLAWDAEYKVGATEVIQVQNIEVYAGDTFFIEYNNVIYTSTFPDSEAMADANSDARFMLTATTISNNKLIP